MITFEEALQKSIGPELTEKVISDLASEVDLWKSVDNEQNHNSIDSVKSLLVTNDKGEPKATSENFKLIMEYDPWFQNVKYNTLREHPVKVIDGIRIPWTDRDNSLSMIYIESQYGIFHHDKFQIGFDGYLADHEFDPLQDLIKSFEWDGQPRCEEFFIKWMNAEDTPYNRELSRILFAGGIHRAFEPGCKFDCVITIIGSQGAGKSTLCRWLALDDEFFTSAKTITGQRGVEAIKGKWIIELEELLAVLANEKAGTKQEDNAKQFLSSMTDYYRIPYKQLAQDVPRHCIFIGTTNRDEFLTDKTGNRRWFPLRCRPTVNVFDHEAEIKAYIHQCWAEMYQAYKDRSEFARPYEKEDLKAVIKAEQSDAEVADYRIGMIDEYLNKGENISLQNICIAELWDRALRRSNFGMPELSNKDSRAIAEILTNKLHWIRTNKVMYFPGYGKQKAYQRPPPETDT